MEEQKWKVLNRDIIKYLAMAAMFLNHFAYVMLQSGSVLREVFEDIGYFTAITMCFFLVEGYAYTRSKRKYGQRLLLFALISQIPFTLVLGLYNLNMIFSLFFCFLILAAREKIENKGLRILAIVGLVVLTGFCDWPFFTAAFTLMFAAYKDSKRELVRSYLISYLLFGALSTINFLLVYPVGTAILHGLLSGIGILVSGVVMMVFYNGKRAEWGRNFSKWFFYAFYPGHLLLIGLLKLVTG